MGSAGPGCDPAWHRRLQQQRQAARLVVQAADSCLRSGILVPPRVCKRLSTAASALNHHGSRRPQRVASYLLDMAGGTNLRDKDSNDGWSAQRRDGKKSKEQWAAEKEAERLRLSKCSWVACNRGRCKAWLYLEDIESCSCTSCHRRWSDPVLQRAQECRGKTPGFQAKAPAAPPIWLCCC